MEKPDVWAFVFVVLQKSELKHRHLCLCFIFIRAEFICIDNGQEIVLKLQEEDGY